LYTRDTEEDNHRVKVQYIYTAVSSVL